MKQGHSIYVGVFVYILVFAKCVFNVYMCVCLYLYLCLFFLGVGYLCVCLCVFW